MRRSFLMCLFYPNMEHLHKVFLSVCLIIHTSIHPSSIILYILLPASPSEFAKVRKGSSFSQINAVRLRELGRERGIGLRSLCKFHGLE